MKFTVRTKLFAAILAANFLLAAVIVVSSNLAFQKRFERYAINNEQKRLEPWIQLLENEYKRDQWQSLDPRRFNTQGRRIPFLLRDDNQQILLGPRNPNGDLIWIPIKVDGNRVGDIGVPDRSRALAELDRQFAEGIQRQAWWIALVAVIISALVALVMARQFVKPLQQITRVLHTLSRGDYSARNNSKISNQRSDELGALARDVDKLATALSEHQQARKQWVADIAHELRTPLAVLQADIEALQDGIRPLDQSAVTRLQGQQERLTSLVNDLAELARSDAGALTYQWAPIDVSQHLSDYLQLHYPNAQVTTSPALVSADEQRLMQLWHNLLSNSQHYSDQPMTLAISIEQLDGNAVIRWSDSSPGVPEASLNKLFDRLYRVDESRNRHSGGSGLGLAIVAQIIAAHDGSISAQHSELGGLCIEITLPILE